MADYSSPWSVAWNVTSEQADWIRAWFATKIADKKEDWQENSFDWDIEDKAGVLVFWAHASYNVDMFVVFASAYTKQWGNCIWVEWANTCSKPRLDGFGGGAAVMAGGKVFSINTSAWIQHTVKKLKKRPINK